MPGLWPSCSTLSSTTSLSQSRRSSCTFWMWPDSSPLCHRRLRERLKYTASPSSAVFASASRFMKANISTSLLPISCAIAGTKPLASHLTSSSQFIVSVYCSRLVRRPSETALGGEPLQHRHGAGQHRPHRDRQRLPGHRLLLAHLERTLPLVDLAEVQPHQRVRVVRRLDLPRVGVADGDAQ